MSLCTALALTLSLSSVHLTKKYQPQYNEENLGISVECDKFAIGTYKNSLNKQSFHIGTIFKHQVHDFTFGANLGVVSGYGDLATPFFRPFVQYKNVRFGFIPQIDSLRTERVITLEYSISL